MAQKMLVKMIMPSEGDMVLVNQDGGTLLLQPVYFGGDCAGPIIQFVDAEDPKKVVTSYRLKFKATGEIRIPRADTV